MNRLSLPTHRAGTATLAGAYPFLTAVPPQKGVPVGVDALSGAPFCYDPWQQYETGDLTNPNLVLAGVIGQGKSALAKSLVTRGLAAGRRAYIPGDPKGEWVPVAHAVGGTVLALHPGGPHRLNPLAPNPGETATTTGQSGRVQLLAAIAQILLRRPLHPSEHDALAAALASLRHDSEATIPAVTDALAAPDPTQAHADHTNVTDRQAAGRDLRHALRRLTAGDLAGMFDAPSTTRLDPDAPMLVLDLSALRDDTALAVATLCAAAWLDTALSAVPGAAARSWIVYDEAWRMLRAPGLLARMQAQWKLSRAHGIANLLILHRLTDLKAVADSGTADRALAEGLLADCSTRVIYRQETDQLAATATAFGLCDTERDLLPALPRGTGLWKLPRASYLVRHRIHPDELELFDTDQAMRTPPISPNPGRRQA